MVNHLGKARKVNFDVAATTKSNDEIVNSMMPYFIEKYCNPSALYRSAVEVKKDIELARKTIAESINVKPKEIIFTSGGSESNCLAIQGWAFARLPEGKKLTIITSMIEHHSVIECVKSLEPFGVEVKYVKIKRKGYYNLQNLATIIDSIPTRNQILMCFQWANNEIGTIQDVGALARIAQKHGAYLHIDAVQAFGQIPIDITKYDGGIDSLSISGHKIHAPKGIGCLYKKTGVNLRPIIWGSQENGLRGGTENVPYIMAFKKAVEISDITMQNRITHVYPKYIKALIKTFDILGFKINGDRYNRLPNNLNITFNKNVTGEAVIYMLDTAGFQISAGSACNSHSQEISPVLKAIGLTEDEAMRTVRITISEDITPEDVFRFEKELERAIDILTME